MGRFHPYWANQFPRCSGTEVDEYGGQHRRSPSDAKVGAQGRRDSLDVPVLFPLISPMPLARVHAPFDHDEWIFEPKLDGFRALAYIEGGAARLVSRRQNVYTSFLVLARLSVPPYRRTTRFWTARSFT